MLIRKPHVAGSFYPSDPSELREFFDSSFQPAKQLVAAKAIVVPHAGYVYSGKTTAHVLSRVQVPETVVLIGPNHNGIGEEFSIDPEGGWETPLGKVSIDSALASELMSRSRHLTANPVAHRFEHSLEVIVPFLQKKNPSVHIVPLLINTMNLQRVKSVALECAEILAKKGGSVLIAVSTDMSHYESDETTRRKDQFALRAIEHMDPDELVHAVQDYRITMCGFVPVYMLLVMREILHFRKATLVDYRTSADATGDYERVVGYAGFVLA
jgi:AmmeMemoRadiSam system protein B